MVAETLHIHPDSARHVLQEGGIKYHLETGRVAHEHGIRYFASCYGYTVPSFVSDFGTRLSMDKEGNPYGQKYLFPCPLDTDYYYQWFAKPLVKIAQTGFVDGLNLDWEFYAGGGEAGVCYCDVCMNTFMSQQRINEPLPAPELRHAWLESRGLLKTHAKSHYRRRVEMFRSFAEAVRRIRPNFVFSGYHMNYHAELPESLHGQRNIQYRPTRCTGRRG